MCIILIIIIIMRQEAEERKRRTDTRVRFDREKAQLMTSMAAFKRLALSVQDSVADASDMDKRQ